MKWLSIPRGVSFILVVAAACGDGDALPGLVDAATPAEDANGEGDGEPADGAEGEPDAGPTDIANLGNGEFDLSNERFQDVAREFCRVAFACDAEQGKLAFGNEEICREDVESLWRSDAEFVSAECADAELHRFACYASVSCEEQESACVRESDAATETCPLFE